MRHICNFIAKNWHRNNFLFSTSLISLHLNSRTVPQLCHERVPSKYLSSSKFTATWWSVLISEQKQTILDFKLSPYSECFTISFGLFLDVWILCADVSEHSVCFIFIGGVRHITFRSQGNYPKQRIQQKQTTILRGCHKWFLTNSLVDLNLKGPN